MKGNHIELEIDFINVFNNLSTTENSTSNSDFLEVNDDTDMTAFNFAS